MRARLAAVALVALFLVLAPGGIDTAAASPAVSTELSISAPTATVAGRPVTVHVVLKDRAGKPVADALIRLVTNVTFIGADHEEVVDEAQTDASGKAVLTFAPTDTGAATVTARFTGARGLAPSEASFAFEVRAPIVAYHPTPVGIQAPWARSYFIVVPFMGVWITYLVVLARARKVRRAGARAPSPQGSS
ncbi:MAG TPA: hypothetical protein VF984_00030 [Actinomycetota bacterium]